VCKTVYTYSLNSLYTFRGNLRADSHVYFCVYQPLTIMVWYGSLNKTYHVVLIKHMHFILDKARECQGVINSHKSIATLCEKTPTDTLVYTYSLNSLYTFRGNLRADSHVYFYVYQPLCSGWFHRTMYILIFWKDRLHEITRISVCITVHNTQKLRVNRVKK
jgi:putative flippase GtrA